MVDSDVPLSDADLDRLSSQGVVCLVLSLDQEVIPQRTFHAFASSLSLLRQTPSLHISPHYINNNDKNDNDDCDCEAHSVTGFHTAGELLWSAHSNLLREGFIFSNGENPLRQTNEIGNEREPSVISSLYLYTCQLEQLLNAIAMTVLQGLERHLEIPSGWFASNLGGDSTECSDVMRQSSQWHLKNYIMPPPLSEAAAQEPAILLPSHMDPSLLSVVILDRCGRQSGAEGLEYWNSSSNFDHRCGWKEVECSGHAVAIVILGSALSYITNGYLYAPRHRVVQRARNNSSDARYYRRAATYFLRPHSAATLRTPPSSRVLQPLTVRPAKQQQQHVSDVTFGTWIARVSKNYRKKKNKKTKMDKKVAHYQFYSSGCFVHDAIESSARSSSIDTTPIKSCV